MEKLEDSPAMFLERCVFPVLLPGLEETLRAAKSTERRRRFNSLDYLSFYLYRNNPQQHNREDVLFQDIPFVKTEWVVNPRPRLPLSATLSEEEAAIIIQAHCRGHLTRSEPNIVEFRKWLRRVRMEKKATRKIQQWWRRVMKSQWYLKKKNFYKNIPQIVISGCD